MNCFVYQAVQNVEVRSAPSTDDTYRTSRSFKKGDLVSIDLIREDYSESLFISDDINNNIKKKEGPFLRLSDGSGWVFERKEGQGVIMVPKVVEKVLECFYVENFPVGIALRNHPVDKGIENNLVKQVPQIFLKPMQKIYCDRKVKGSNSVNFYRVQQGPNQCPAWVFDSRGDDSMLMPASKVEVGIFAFRVIANAKVNVRLSPNVGDENRSDWFVRPNEFVVCDMIRESLKPENGNGPFLRLVDGSGWLFCKKYHEEMMEEVCIEEGTWILRVTNSVGIALRKQPIDQTKSLFDKVYEENEVVKCDRKIGPSTSGITFFRVEGTSGWVFDRRKDHLMMELMSHQSRFMPNESPAKIKSNGWTVEFVRGVAFAAVEGVDEISVNAESRVISFRHPTGARINVYYTTRTVGTALDHPSQGRTQLFRRNCSKQELVEVFKDPRVHTGHGYKRSHKRPLAFDDSSASPREEEIGAEDDLRNRLIDVSDENDCARIKMDSLWQSVRVHQENRIYTEAKRWKRFEAHVEKLAKARQEREAAAAAARELQERTCQECGRVFGSPHALLQHTADAHSSYTCYVCHKWFKNLYALNQHKNALGHW